MKTLAKWIAGIAGLALMTGTLLAQNDTSSQTTAPNEPSSSQPSGTRQLGSQAAQPANPQSSSRELNPTMKKLGHFFDVKRLIGENVSSQQGESLGHIKDVAVNSRSGEVFALIGIGNGRDAVVPVEAMHIRKGGNGPQVTLNATRQDLQSAPVVQSKDWLDQLNSPGFTQRIYSRYGLAQPSPEVGMVIIESVPPGSGNSYPKQGNGGSQLQPDSGQRP